MYRQCLLHGGTSAYEESQEYPLVAECGPQTYSLLKTALAEYGELDEGSSALKGKILKNLKKYSREQRVIYPGKPEWVSASKVFQGR